LVWTSIEQQKKEEMEVTEDIAPKDINGEFVVKYHFENHQTNRPEYKSTLIID